MLLPENHTEFEATADSLSIPVIRAYVDLNAALFPRAQTLTPVDGHLSKYGNAILAKAVEDWLITNCLVDKGSPET